MSSAPQARAGNWDVQVTWEGENTGEGDTVPKRELEYPTSPRFRLNTIGNSYSDELSPGPVGAYKWGSPGKTTTVSAEQTATAKVRLQWVPETDERPDPAPETVSLRIGAMLRISVSKNINGGTRTYTAVDNGYPDDPRSSEVDSYTGEDNHRYVNQMLWASGPLQMHIETVPVVNGIANFTSKPLRGGAKHVVTNGSTYASVGIASAIVLAVDNRSVQIDSEGVDSLFDGNGKNWKRGEDGVRVENKREGDGSITVDRAVNWIDNFTPEWRGGSTFIARAQQFGAPHYKWKSEGAPLTSSYSQAELQKDKALMWLPGEDHWFPFSSSSPYAGTQVPMGFTVGSELHGDLSSPTSKLTVTVADGTASNAVTGTNKINIRWHKPSEAKLEQLLPEGQAPYIHQYAWQGPLSSPIIADGAIDPKVTFSYDPYWMQFMRDYVANIGDTSGIALDFANQTGTKVGLLAVKLFGENAYTGTQYQKADSNKLTMFQKAVELQNQGRAPAALGRLVPPGAEATDLWWERCLLTQPLHWKFLHYQGWKHHTYDQHGYAGDEFWITRKIEAQRIIGQYELDPSTTTTSGPLPGE